MLYVVLLLILDLNLNYTIMKQLELFLDKLRNAGYEVTTSWQKDLSRGYLEHVKIRGDIGSMYVLFQVYEESQGYQMYIESRGSTFEDDIKIIQGIVD